MAALSLKHRIAYFGIDADRFPGRETLAAFEALIAENDGNAETVAVFTHGFPINILLSHALGHGDMMRALCLLTRSITRRAGQENP